MHRPSYSQRVISHFSCLWLSGLLMMMPLLAIPAQAAPDFQEGEWKITTHIEMPGISFTPPSVTMSQCLTAKDRIPKSKDIGKKCKIVEQSSSGNTLQWVMHCDNANGITEAKGTVTYSGETMQAISQLTISGNGKTMQMNSHMTGHHVGSCK